jgi:hypothetical protein
VGKTRSPEDSTNRIDDVEGRLSGPLSDDTWVHPGHGEDTTPGAGARISRSGARGW